MGDEETVHGAVEDDDLDVFVRLQRGDGFVELRNRLGAKDVQRWHVEGHPPEPGECFVRRTWAAAVESAMCELLSQSVSTPARSIADVMSSMSMTP